MEVRVLLFQVESLQGFCSLSVTAEELIRGGLKGLRPGLAVLLIWRLDILMHN